MLSSGFTGAPISRLCITFLIAASIAAGLMDIKYMFYVLVVPHLWGYWQIWRIAVWQVCSDNFPDYIIFYSNGIPCLFSIILSCS